MQAKLQHLTKRLTASLFMRSVIISGGGTGGHIFPAISIAQEIRRRHPGCRILFVGAKGKMEMEKVPQAGFDIVGLPITGISRKLSFSNLLLPFKLVYSILASLLLIINNKPQIVIGVGGFASGPLLIASAILFRRILIQEQNSLPGITNRLISRRATVICVAYPKMERYFPAAKLRLTGNPVRKSLLEISGIPRAGAKEFFKIPSDCKVLFVTGGSLGARSVNEAISSFLPSLQQSGMFLIWQTGKPYFDRARQEVEKLNAGGFVYVTDFLSEMHLAYAAADLVVSRAGAGAIAEIAIAGVPAILVPYPFAAEDHQTFNAKALSENRAAVFISDKEVMHELQETVIKVMRDEGLRSEMKSALKQFAKPDATSLITNEIEKICR